MRYSDDLALKLHHDVCMHSLSNKQDATLKEFLRASNCDQVKKVCRGHQILISLFVFFTHS